MAVRRGDAPGRPRLQRHDRIAEAERDARARPAPRRGTTGSRRCSATSSPVSGPGLSAPVSSTTTSPGRACAATIGRRRLIVGTLEVAAQHLRRAESERGDRQAAAATPERTAGRPIGSAAATPSARYGHDAARLRTPKMWLPSALTTASPIGVARPGTTSRTTRRSSAGHARPERAPDRSTQREPAGERSRPRARAAPARACPGSSRQAARERLRVAHRPVLEVEPDVGDA